MARAYRNMRMIALVGGIHGAFGLSESDCVVDVMAIRGCAEPEPGTPS